jgi:hypothetical protein
LRYTGARSRTGELIQNFYFLDVSRDELAARLIERNKALPPDTFHMEPSQLDVWIGHFERPTADELE